LRSQCVTEKNYCWAAGALKILSRVITSALATELRVSASSTWFKRLMNSIDFNRRLRFSSSESSISGIVHSCSLPLNLSIFMSPILMTAVLPTFGRRVQFQYRRSLLKLGEYTPFFVLKRLSFGATVLEL
jgi:hypothetical protein